MFIDAIHRDNDIYVWLRDEEGTLHFLRVDAPYYCYHEAEDGELTSIFGDIVTKKEFRTRKALEQFTKTHKNVFESDISPLDKFLSDTFYKTPNTPINVGFFDIEADYDLSNGLGFPTADNPHGIINALSLYDSNKDKFYLLYVSDTEVTIDIGNDDVDTFRCFTEKHLLDTFFELIEDIDVLCGWNSEGYDIPYIVSRARTRYSKKNADTKLCRNGFSINEREKLNEFKNKFIQYSPIGRVHLDYLQLYKKFTFQEKTSYALESIAQEELGYGKIDYDGDLGDLYRTDIKRFLEYNLHDVRLLRDLEQKLRFVDLAINLSRQSTIRIPEVMGTIKPIEQAIRNYAHYDRKHPLILPDKKEHDVSGKFEGAWVCDPIPDSYSWVTSIDLASLYPSIIRSLGIGPETFIMQCRNGEEDFKKIISGEKHRISLTIKGTDEQIAIDSNNLRSLIKNEGYTLSANGSIFAGTPSLLGEVLDIWFSGRTKMKKKSYEFAQKGDTSKADFYDMHQYILKVRLNSLYGCISNKYSRFFDLDMAKSVTLTGQYINRFQAYSADSLIETVK